MVSDDFFPPTPLQTNIHVALRSIIMIKAELIARPEAFTEQTYCVLGMVPEVQDTASCIIPVEEGVRQHLGAGLRRMLTRGRRVSATVS